MSYLNRPLPLEHTRVRRTYSGGALLDRWQGIYPGRDGRMPESWIASTIVARYAENPDTGLSIIQDSSVPGVKLKNYIADAPKELLGRRHFSRFGTELGFLTKIIDSSVRLNIQAHPTRDLARRYFDSEFGKAEAWYVLGGRSIGGERPYILLGFKPGITRDRWVRMVADQDIPALEASLHRIPVEPGDVYFVPGGMPHAIGAGCMVAEIQEPTDITLRVERMADASGPYPEETYHQGIGYEKMFECFDYRGYALPELLERVRSVPHVRKRDAGVEVEALLDPERTPYFSLDKVSVGLRAELVQRDGFSSAVVISGTGTLSRDGATLQASPSSEFFLPPSEEPLILQSYGDEPLELLICYPPSRRILGP